MTADSPVMFSVGSVVYALRIGLSSLLPSRWQSLASPILWSLASSDALGVSGDSSSYDAPCAPKADSARQARGTAGVRPCLRRSGSAFRNPQPRVALETGSVAGATRGLDDRESHRSELRALGLLGQRLHAVDDSVHDRWTFARGLRPFGVELEADKDSADSNDDAVGGEGHGLAVLHARYHDLEADAIVADSLQLVRDRSHHRRAEHLLEDLL